MLSEVSLAQKHKGQVFSHMWKIDPKEKQGSTGVEQIKVK
jgi:hypothetical protein